MAKKIIGIYMITCLANSKRYIGQSIDIKRRFSQHRRKPSNQMLADFEQYGLDAFKFEILEECAANELDKKETAYMNELQPEYNIRSEGNGISDEAREKMRKFQTGKKRPEISRQVKCVETGEVFESITAAAKWCNVLASNLGVLLKGKGRTAGGYHWIYADEDEEAALERIRQMPEGRQRTEESKEKQRKAMTGRKHTPEHSEKIRQSHIGQGWKPSTYEKRCRKVLCIETGETFPSIKAAAEFYNLKRPNISAVLSGVNNICGGFHWQYVDGQPPHHSSEEKEPVSPKLIRCVETQEVFQTLVKASTQFNISTAAISHVLYGRAKTAGGYHWEFFTA